MNWSQLSANYWTSPQIGVEHVAKAKEFGIEAVVCNRPDGETTDQIPHADIMKACEQQGIEFSYLPMQGPEFTEDYVAKVKQLISDNKKVLAYCRSGNRSAILYDAATK